MASDFPSKPELQPATFQPASSLRALCKVASALLTAIFLMFLTSRPWHPALLWAASPIILLALLDAHSRSREAATSKPLGIMAQASGLFRGLLSPSVWPYYLILAGLGVACGLTMPPVKPDAVEKTGTSRLTRAVYPQVLPPGFVPQDGQIVPGPPGLSIPRNLPPRPKQTPKPTAPKPTDTPPSTTGTSAPKTNP